MILNEKQYQITLNQIDSFSKALENIKQKNIGSNRDKFSELESQALLSQLLDLQAQAEEYKSLINQPKRKFTANSLEELSKALVQARISAKLTQEDLSKKLGLNLYNIEQYELTFYEDAEFGLIRNIIKILDIQIGKNVYFPTATLSRPDFEHKLKNAGIEKNFLYNVLLGSNESGKLSNLKNIGLNLFSLKILDKLCRIYHWNRDKIIGQDPIKLDLSVIPQVSFKGSKRVKESEAVNAYVIYAHYIVLLINQITTNLVQKPISKDPFDLRKIFFNEYPKFSLENFTRFVWRFGIPVIALDDIGIFYGACFRENDRKTIVLKNNSNSLGRWMFDLFHELYHVIYDNDQIIHNSDFRTMIKEGMPEDENMANKFANAFLLGPNYQDLVNTCLKHANYDLALLKSSVQTIANRKSLPVDILANLVAYNLSLQNKDWWGAAENLQTKDPIYKPQSIVNNVLLQRININLLSKPDLDILTPIIT